MKRRQLDVTVGMLTVRDRDDVLGSVERTVECDSIADQIVGLGETDGLLPAGCRVVVRIHSPLVQVRTLGDVPPVSGRDLPNLVRANHSRFFRKIDGEAVVAAAWATNSAGQRAVRAVSVPLDLLCAIEEGLEAVGAGPYDVVPVLNGEELPLRPTTPRMDRRARLRRRIKHAAALALAASGWLVSATAYVTDLVGDGRRVRGELAALAGPLAQIRQVEADLEAFTPVAAALDRQSSERDRISDTLLGLDTVLPRTAHLHSLVVERAGSVRLVVHGEDPVEVVRALREWWPGPVRITETREPEEATDVAEFAVTLERDG